MNKNDVVLFTHDDLDGMGCAVLTTLAYQHFYISFSRDEATLDKNFDAYLGNINFDDCPRILIADNCLTMEKCKEVDAVEGLKGNIAVIDHHKTRKFEQGLFPWVHITVEEDGKPTCGTSLLYQSFVNEGRIYPTPAIEEFVELVRVQDADWKNPRFADADKLNDLNLALPHADFVFRMAKKLATSHEFGYTEEEENIIATWREEYDKQMEEYINSIVVKDFDGFRVGYVEVNELFRTNIAKVVKTRPIAKEIDFLLLPNGDRASLRQINPNVDVSTIAKAYGGGGNQYAGSFPLENLPENIAQNE